MTQTVYIYVLDTMADWEIGFLTAELNSRRFFKKDASPVNVVTIGLNNKMITSMGGLKIQPDLDLSACEIKENDALILPGGETWMDPMHQPVLDLAKHCLEKNIVVAGICGATMALAEQGLLNARDHTSNDLGYMKMICPNYAGENQYIHQPAVTDNNLITASGIAPLEFTMNVLKTLNVFLPETLEAWYNLYKTQDQKYFYALMQSMQ